MIYASTPAPALQFIPARGRKSHRHAPAWHSVRIAIYPREGTETVSSDLSILIVVDCNLSPRGDGNHHYLYHFRHCYHCNLSPRGDGNTRQGNCGSESVIAIYPREGTETKAGVTPAQCGYCNLSPRGDGNRTFRPVMPNFDTLQFIPARGRKHKIGPAHNKAAFHCNLSPRGDGN